MANQAKNYIINNGTMQAIDYNPFLSQDSLARNTREVELFARKVSSGFGKVKVGVQCGSDLDTYCQPINKEKLQQIMRDFVKMITSKYVPVNGKTVEKNKWCIGSFGSIWLDMDAKKYDVDYIRCALSIKSLQSEWKHGDIPYVILITVEKGKDEFRTPTVKESNLDKKRRKRQEKKQQKQEELETKQEEEAQKEAQKEAQRQRDEKIRLQKEQELKQGPAFLPYPVPDISMYNPYRDDFVLTPEIEAELPPLEEFTDDEN